ncbi:MAG: rRNA pseudouridine synthase [Coriobacteriia bacterium]|nr:rRNA pseudouridine synthase [Coriobacteriia bacterium]
MPDLTPMRLHKFLARAGVASRRAAESLISSGHVKVNQQVVTSLGYKVDPGTDEVRVDGRLVELILIHSYIMLNKPAGYLTTMDDPQGRLTVRELIPQDEVKGLFPVGRLDLDTHGLLLFMTDGELANCLLHPRGQVKKRYRVVADGLFGEKPAAALRSGVELSDGITLPAEIEIGEVSEKQLSPRQKLRLAEDKGFSKWQTEVFCTITEGRKRQVKRMFMHVGHPVLELSREAFGPLVIGDLPLGSWRYLTDEELEALKRDCGYPV